MYICLKIIKNGKFTTFTIWPKTSYCVRDFGPIYKQVQKIYNKFEINSCNFICIKLFKKILYISCLKGLWCIFSKYKTLKVTYQPQIINTKHRIITCISTLYTGSISCALAVSTDEKIERRVAGIIWPPPRCIGSRCIKASIKSNLTPLMFSSQSTLYKYTK